MPVLLYRSSSACFAKCFRRASNASGVSLLGDSPRECRNSCRPPIKAARSRSPSSDNSRKRSRISSSSTVVCRRFAIAFDVVIEHFVAIRVCLNLVVKVLRRVRWPHFLPLENHHPSARKYPFITAIRQPVRQNLLGRLAEVPYF
jgi:hypothetical protein